MKKNIEVEVELNADEVVSEMWAWDSEEQSDFLKALALLYKYNRVDFLYQLQSISEEINSAPNAYNKDLIVKVLSTTLEYILGEGDGND